MRSVEDSLQRLGTCADRHPAGPRPRRLDPRLARRRGAPGSRSSWRAATGRWSSCASRARSRRSAPAINETAACQDLAERGDFDCFLLAGRYTLLEQAPLDELPAAVRAARHRADHRRRLQHRHPRDRRGRGRLLPVRAGAARDHGAGAPDRGGLRAPRRAPADRGAAVPARPPGGGDGDPGHALACRGRAERRDFRAEMPADFWAELKQEGLLRPDAPTP